MRTELVINHPKLQVTFVRGSEGPQHDPYAYEEIHATTPLGKTVLHEGLGVWVKHKGKAVIKMVDGSLATRVFEQYVGFTPAQLQRIVKRLQSQCTKCGGREFECVSGYPGETFEICVKCKHVNTASMDFSAIE